MIDKFFDINLWLFWREFIFWSLIFFGFFSSIISLSTNQLKSNTNTTGWTILVLLFLVVILGCFPIEWGYQTDRSFYAENFLKMKYQPDSIWNKDKGFVILSKYLASFLNVSQYFITLALIYTVNYFIAIKSLVNRKCYWLFIAVVLSMGFTSYAINTIRAGIAISLVVLSFIFYNSRKWKMIVCLLIASSIHNSVMIPSLIIILCSFYNNTRLFYKLWFLSIPVSLFAGGFFTNFFAGIGEDERVNYLITTETQYNVGFRIDFIIYSLIPLLVGGYYIFKKKFNDNFYTLLYNSYILTNIFWILVIRANYSDRFAYLSWFMIPFVLVYPLLKGKMEIRENIWLSLILLGETLFRFYIRL